MSTAMTLSTLAEGLFSCASFEQIKVSGLTKDSRAVKQGDAFIAVPGLTAHGLNYLNATLAKNASIVLYEPPVPDGVVVPENALAVVGLARMQGQIADRFYGSPSNAMNVIGVTGTNGKTSTVQLIAQAFTLLGQKSGTIGTLGTGMFGQLVAGDRTTPDVVAVHKALAVLQNSGAQVVAMEVSSHALEQDRVACVAFASAVFSNLTLDHLDYHGSMQAYFEAKAKLFAWPTLRNVIINVDDAYGLQILERLPSALNVFSVSSRGHSNARLSAQTIELSLAGMSFNLRFAGQSARVHSSLLGRFNVDNLLAVAAVLLAQDIQLIEVAQLLSQLSPVAGRMSRLGGHHNKPLVVIDYAHTPDALEQTLMTLRSHSQARLICVFGCGGDRDRSKRPLMAACAEKWADIIWVVDDNPRTESGDAIVAEICAGFARPNVVNIQRDRRVAIGQAIALAHAEDIVLIAGKGHETYQEINGVKTPFDDYAIAAEFLGEAA